jgi:hypothetical protein
MTVPKRKSKLCLFMCGNPNIHSVKIMLFVDYSLYDLNLIMAQCDHEQVGGQC